MEWVHLLSYPQAKPAAFGDSFAKVEPKSSGPLEYESVDPVHEGSQMRSDRESPQGAFTMVPGEDKDRAPRSKLETATGSLMNTPQPPATSFPFPTGW